MTWTTSYCLNSFFLVFTVFWFINLLFVYSLLICYSLFICSFVCFFVVCLFIVCLLFVCCLLGFRVVVFVAIPNEKIMTLLICAVL